MHAGQTPLAIAKRWQRDGGDGLATALKAWKPWTPPKPSQALQQGGVLIFDGPKLVWAHRDEATGAHTSVWEIIERALQE
jgi:AhpC/TSA antioxidant enzyme